MSHKYAMLLLTAGIMLFATVGMYTPPAASEELEENGITIIRDDFGVPHVFVTTGEEADLWYGVGYAQAQDRLWQADLLRNLATGRLAEFQGPDFIESDVVSRLIFGSDQDRTALLETASPETQEILEAFAAGMNAWIAEATLTGQLPPEYVAFGLTPRPWEPEDSLAVFRALSTDFGARGDNEDRNQAYLAELAAIHGPEEAVVVFNDTHWIDDPNAPTTVPAEGAITPPNRRFSSEAHLPAKAVRALKRIKELREAWENGQREAGITPGAASNAVVIGPELSADGQALLLGGPQLGYSTPQPAHEMGLHIRGRNLVGGGFAGTPGILFGVSNRYAWTVTTGGSDVVDLYVEVLNPANPTEYLFNGEFLPFECRTETFDVLGAPPITQELCETIHGPVLAVDLTTNPPIAITRKTVLQDSEVQNLEALLAANRARTLVGFLSALPDLTVNFNVLYAGARGNIGYQHVGLVPVRAEGDNPFLLKDGTGSAEWQGFVPFEDMPRAFNPEQGFLTNWNNKPAPGWPYPTEGFWNWGPVHRVETLNRLIAAEEPGTITLDTLRDINQAAGQTIDTPSGNPRYVVVSLLEEMLADVDTSADPRLPQVVRVLEDWDLQRKDLDNDGLYDEPAGAIFNTWWDKWVLDIFVDDLLIECRTTTCSDENLIAFASTDRTVDTATLGNLTYRLLNDPDSDLLQHDYLELEPGETLENARAEALTNALIAALDDLEQEFGTALSDWQEPIAVIEWTPLGAGQVPDTIWMNRGTYNQIVDLGTRRVQRAINIVPPGQSGNPLDPHFADQLQLYATWQYKTMRLDLGDLRGNIESITRISPEAE